MVASPSTDGESCSLALKIIYTLHGLESVKYIVKPSKRVALRAFRGISLAILEIQPCVAAMRTASPEFAGICDTHSNDYAVYSVDFSEDDLPLQCHGKVSQDSVIEATGKLCSSTLQGEHVEVHIHVLPIRKPGEMLAKAEEELNRHLSDVMQSDFLHSDASAAALMPAENPQQQQIQANDQRMQHLFPFLPALPPQVQIPPALLRNEPALPSSPPVRARPTKIAPPASASASANASASASHASNASNASSNVSTAAKRPLSEAQPAKKRRSTTSPTNAKDEAAHCRNCGVEAASTWRRVELPEGNRELLCNACALYYKSKRVMRPSELWERRTRTENDLGAATRTTSASGHVLAGRRPSSMRRLSHQLKGAAQQHRHQQHQQHPQMHPQMHQLPPQYQQPSSSTSSTSTIHHNQQHSHSYNHNQQSHQPYTMPSVEATHESIELWSRETASQFLRSDDAELSDRLVDNPLKLSKTDTPSNTTTPETPIEPPISSSDNIDSSMKVTLDPPSTPRSRQTPTAPDSIQKLFNFTTPDQKSTLLLPGSGSTGKWLRKVMNNAEFEEFLRSPSARDDQSIIPDLSAFTSSPPTSSNLFSEVSDWQLPGPLEGSPTKRPLHHNSGVQIK